MKDTAMTAMTTKKDNPTDNVAKTADAMVAAGQEALRNFAKSSTEGYGNAFAGMRDKAGDLVQGYDELAISGKDSMEHRRRRLRQGPGSHRWRMDELRQEDAGRQRASD